MKTTATKRGPKPKVTDKAKAVVLGAIGAGASIADAAGIIEVGARTIRDAMTKDPKFRSGVIKARKNGKIRLIKKVTKAKAWQAAAWYLERMYGSEFGRKDKYEHTGKGGGPIQTLTTHAIDYDQIRRDLEAFASGGSADRRVPPNGHRQSVHSDNAD